jgi:hypothetical protein
VTVPIDIRDLIPKHKYDLGTANEAVAAGFPAVEPILPDLLVWLQDYNWPVSRPLIPLLISVGKPLIPEIRKVLRTTDDTWKYWVLGCIVEVWSPELIAELKADLDRIATTPTPGERSEEVDLKAREVLEKLRPL